MLVKIGPVVPEIALLKDLF